jgi:hypothetical protein
MARRRAATVVAAGATLVALVGTPTGSVAAADRFTHTATGTVFFPNPVTSLGLQSLTDNKDADDPVFRPAYRRVTLTNLDASGSLNGGMSPSRAAPARQRLLRRGRSRPSIAMPTSSSR